jgi:hypothetical protein
MAPLPIRSKLDRSAGLIERLIANGKTRAPLFFSPMSLWPRAGCVPAKAVWPGQGA